MAEGKDEVILSEEASTATFGQTFQRAPVGPSIAGWYLGTPLLLTTADDPQGCRPVRNLTPNPGGKPFVLLVDRGGCTFVDKALRAADSGAVGLIVADYEHKPADESGAIRPAAVHESDPTLHRLARLAVTIIAHQSATLARLLLGAARITVGVESVEESDLLASNKREGRLVVGDHEIVNMRVIEL
jgi:hypothetical protein